MSSLLRRRSLPALGLLGLLNGLLPCGLVYVACAGAVAVELPALRERSTDIPLLAEHFVKRFNEKNRRKVTGIHPDAMFALQHYYWPGNIRELENLLERTVILKG